MEKNTGKKYINSWLEDDEFIRSLEFKDEYYLSSLCLAILNYVKNIPIPVQVEYDRKHHRIYFQVGGNKKNSKGFDVDTDIAVYDMQTIIKRWIYNFFPRYDLYYEKEFPLTAEEIVKMREEALKKKEKFDLNDALLVTKKRMFHEWAVIEREARSKDEFMFNKNGIRTFRVTGSLQRVMSITDFLKTLHRIENQEERKNFIFENSVEIAPVDENKESRKEIFVSYAGKQMLNFFAINFPDCHKYKLRASKDGFLNYRWGRFRIKFNTILLRQDCLNWYRNAMKENNYAYNEEDLIPHNEPSRDSIQNEKGDSEK